MYVLTGLGVTVGFHRMLTHRSFQAPEAGRVRVRRARLDGGPGPGDGTGSPTTASTTRTPTTRATRTAPTWATATATAGVLRGLWHAHVGWLLSDQGQASARKYAPDVYEDRGMRIISRALPAARPRSASLLPALAGWAADRRLARRRRHRPALGRPRAHLLRAPRDLERQLGLPLPRHAPLRDRRPVHQRGLAVAALVRRVLAPQPPRLPALGRARAAPLGARARPVGARDQEPREARAGAQRGAHRARAPGAAPDGARARCSAAPRDA